MLVMCAFISCEKVDDEPEQMNEDNLENIHGKWMVSNSTIYKSFEFTDRGVCIIVEKSMAKSSVNDEIVNIGTYDLDDLGKGIIIWLETGDTRILDDILLTSESASFTVSDPAYPNNIVTVESDRAEEMEESERTNLLAKSWMVVSATVIDEEGIPHTFQLLEDNVRMIFSLTYSGTFSSFVFLNDEEERAFGNWMWSDNTETVVKVWSNDESFGNAQMNTISSLTENSVVISNINTDGLRVTHNCILEPSGLFW